MKKITLLLFLFTIVFSSKAQLGVYEFTQSTSTYTEITGGTLLGTETTDDQRFVDPATLVGGTVLTGPGFPIGFDFTFNGEVYDRFAVNANGWISLGKSSLTPSINNGTTSAYTPISSVVAIAPEDLTARISGLGKDLQAQVGATLRIETIGTAPNRELVVQWKNYKKFGTNGTGDNFNFQIRLIETSNDVKIIYGSFVSNANTAQTFQVGLRGAPSTLATNFNSRTSSTNWSATNQSVDAVGSILMNDLIIPSNGLTYTFSIPDCPPPSGLVTSNITTNSATINWNALTPAPTTYEYFVSTSTTSPAGSGTTTTDTSASIISLTQNTTYYVFLRSNCASETSQWYLAGTFKTLCDGVADYIMTFEGIPTGVGTLPDCWSRAGTSANVYNTTASVAPMSPPNRLYMNISATTTAYAIVAPFSNLQADTHRFKFKAYATATGKILQVGYFTNPADVSTFVSLEDYQMPSTAASTAIEFTLVPTNVPVGVSQLVFSIFPGTATTIYIDDIKWEVNSTCVEPSALSAVSISNLSADLTWTPGGAETSWDIQWGLQNFTLGSGTIVTGVSNPHSLINLTESTSYQYYVRAVCDGNVLSPWAGPFSFKTQCDDKTDWEENFDSYSGAGTTNLPDCWARGGSSILTYITTGSVLPASPANRLYMSANGSGATPTETYAMLPLVSNLQANTHRLRFKAYSTSGTDRFIELGYLTDPSDVNSFFFLEEISLPGTTAVTAQQFIYTPTGIPAGIKRLAIKNPGHPSGTTIAYLDDMYWETIPTCIEPSAVVIGSVLAESASISWTAPSTSPAEGYEYYLSTSNVQPANDAVATGSVGAGITTANLTGLNPTTVYYIWVRSVCSTSDKSNWTVIASFTTPCASFTPYYLQDFATFLPSCWNKFAAGTIATGPTGATNTGSWFGRAFLNGSSGNGAVINIFSIAPTGTGWLVSPVFDLNTGGYQLKYDVGTTDYFNTNPIEGAGTMGSDDFVHFLMSIDGGATWTILETYNTANTPANASTTKVYNIPTVTATSVKFAFYGSSGTVNDNLDYDFFIDNFIIQAIPLAAPDCATNVTATINANCGNVATVIAWDSASGSDGYKLTLGTTTGGNDVLDNFIVGGTSYPFVGNLNTTYYYKVVPFNANGDATGCAEQSFTTAIEGCACIPSSTNTSDYISNFSTTNAAVNLVFPNAAMSPGGYGNYYNTQSISHFADSSFNFSNTFVGGSNGLRIWVDWNNNFTFEDSEVVFYQVNADLTKTGTITVPAGTADGNYRMRVRAQWGSAASPTACGSITWGEALDFKLIIDNTLSTGGFDLTNFSAYPNPVKDVFNFAYSNTISDLVIYNLLGQQVLATKPNATQGQVDMSSFPNGTYLVKVTSENQIKTIKVIKN
ncbi:MAG: GEVED domain-containing protein [Flavobacterium sp.]|nr:GEVED domain-containing protein [Flavobacterium sp.]